MTLVRKRRARRHTSTTGLRSAVNALSALGGKSRMPRMVSMTSFPSLCTWPRPGEVARGPHTPGPWPPLGGDSGLSAERGAGVPTVGGDLGFVWAVAGGSTSTDLLKVCGIQGDVDTALLGACFVGGVSGFSSSSDSAVQRQSHGEVRRWRGGLRNGGGQEGQQPTPCHAFAIAPRCYSSAIQHLYLTFHACLHIPSLIATHNNIRLSKLLLFSSVSCCEACMRASRHQGHG